MGLFAHEQKYAGVPDCVARGVRHLYKQCEWEYDTVTTAHWFLYRVWEKSVKKHAKGEKGS